MTCVLAGFLINIRCVDGNISCVDGGVFWVSALESVVLNVCELIFHLVVFLMSQSLSSVSLN